VRKSNTSRFCWRNVVTTVKTRSRRVPRVRHYYQPPMAVPPDRHHRGVVPVAKFFSNRLIEIPHQCNLF
jgi:hypothetical protein